MKCQACDHLQHSCRQSSRLQSETRSELLLAMFTYSARTPCGLTFCISSPATQGERWWDTPSVEACARCAQPKASFTYRSAQAASCTNIAGLWFQHASACLVQTCRNTGGPVCKSETQGVRLCKSKTLRKQSYLGSTPQICIRVPVWQREDHSSLLLCGNGCSPATTLGQAAAA